MVQTLTDALHIQRTNQAHRILRLNQVLERTGKSRSAFYSDMAKGLCPSSIHIGARSVGWLESEIDAYIQGCIAASRNTNQGAA